MALRAACSRIIYDNTHVLINLYIGGDVFVFHSASIFQTYMM